MKGVLLALALYAGPAMAQHSLTYEDARFTYTLSVDSVLSPDSVNYDCTVRSIVIRRKADHKLIQTIRPGENDPSCGLSKEEILIIEDVNFDGLNDIRLLQFLPAGPNLPYYYWVYDRRTGLFQRNKALEVITSPDFDPDKKLIYSFYRTSCCEHGSRTYKYINGVPVLIEDVNVATDEEDTVRRNITIVKKRVNGKMKVVERTVEKEGN